MMKTVIYPLNSLGIEKYRMLISSPYNTIEKRNILLPEEFDEEGDTDVIEDISIEITYSDVRKFPDMGNYYKDVKEFWLSGDPEKSNKSANKQNHYESFMCDPEIQVLNEQKIRFGVSYMILVEYMHLNKMSDACISKPSKVDRKTYNFDPVTQTYIIK